MKKLFFSFAALSALFFVACSNKDKSTPNSNASANIIGTWVLAGSGVKYYDANNNLLSTAQDPYNLIGVDTVKFTNTLYIDYYGDFPDTANYTLNTNVNPMVLTISYINDGNGNPITTNILSLTNTQMIMQGTTVNDKYQDPTTGSWINCDHSITTDTVTKIK
jgi:hypothetical protein